MCRSPLYVIGIVIHFVTVLQKSNKSEKKWFGKEKSAVPSSPPSETVIVPHPLLPPSEEVKPIEVEDEQTKHSHSVAVATGAAAEAAIVAAQAAAEVVRLTSVTRFAGKSKEEVAAIKIQTAFRGYMVRLFNFWLNLN